MKDLSSSVETLARKTESLISAYTQGVDRIAQLEEEKRHLAAKLERASADTERLREENRVLKMASAIKGDEETVSESKRRISQLVREIDRCIALLND